MELPGVAYVFDRAGTTWTERQKLIGSGGGASFGCPLALSGDTAVVGQEDFLASGFVYVFERGDATGTPCADWESCASGTCQDGICACIESNALPCVNGYACVAGVCLDGCASDADCALGHRCNAPTCEVVPLDADALAIYSHRWPPVDIPRVIPMAPPHAGYFSDVDGRSWDVSHVRAYTTGCCGTNTNWSYVVKLAGVLGP